MDCSTCTDKTCLKTGKPCKKIENLMKSQGIFNASFIRPLMSSKRRKDGGGRSREVPFSALKTFNIDGEKQEGDSGEQE